MSTKILPWVDKYRPTKIKNVVHQQELMKTLQNVLNTGEMQHMLFYGPPGTGKTTTILALAHDLFGPKKFNERVLELNASDERGINVVRDDIITFAKLSISNADPNFICPPFKILILDEADAMTPDAQSALRKVMEETSRITRFCIICNYVDKIIEPLISRCMAFRFTPINNEIMSERLKFIAKNEHLHLDNDIFSEIVEIAEGDLRKGIMLLQNINYYATTKNNQVTVNDVCDIVGVVPTYKINELLSNLKSPNIDVTKLAKEFYSQGYSIENFCEKLSFVIMSDETLSDIDKSKILMKNAGACEKMIDGANELLQLIKILYFIHTKYFQTENKN